MSRLVASQPFRWSRSLVQVAMRQNCIDSPIKVFDDPTSLYFANCATGAGSCLLLAGVPAPPLCPQWGILAGSRGEMFDEIVKRRCGSGVLIVKLHYDSR